MDLRKKFIQSLDRKKVRDGSKRQDEAKDIGDKFILMYIGSLGEDRGLRELLKAYKSLNSRENMMLIVGGHGAIEDNLVADMKDMDNTLFIGRVLNKDVPLYTKACDAVFMMIDPKVKSYKIAMPNKLFEAMAADKPVIASSDTLYGEVVKKENCGITICYGDIEALKKAISGLASDPTLRNKLGKNGLDAARREYN